jgi:hypothetical protein
LCRSAATGEEATKLDEARRRLDAAATNLAYAAIGQADPTDVLTGAIRLVDQASRLIDQATTP